MKKPPKPLVARKLLVAAVGVATVNLAAAACSGGSGTSPTSGNLPVSEAGNADTATPPTSGNLVGPGPVDAADAGDAGEDADAGDADAADAEDADGA